MLFFMAIGQFVDAQNSVIEKQKIVCEKRNWNIEFLKKTITTLQEKGQMDSLSGIVDEYLMTLPVKERYTGDNLAYFLEYIKSLDASSLLSVIKDWENIPLNELQKEQIVKKIDNVCKTILFEALYRNNEEIKCPDVDCSSIQQMLKVSKVPVSRFRISLIDMWQGWRNQNVDDMIQAFRQIIFSESAESANGGGVGQLDLMFDASILGYMFNFILEKCNLVQCSRMLEMIDSSVEKNGQEGLGDIVRKVRDNFEGKKMMIEMGEE
ncbi:MAG: hypothetical protein KH111_18700 [Bacteroidales bacterium]|nr:hypothetical protein [Bacteroidales bacterium]